ncbi:MAG: 6-carboxytetrahydropterin synthase QueD [Chloroflexi bacterium]|nr:6-carboxytetrahydropterin synthase QueD [Chloroflexota bacterium]
MYRVSVRRHFDAAHWLRCYQGKCENVHGHRWEVIVTIASAELDSEGMAFDFTLLKKELDKVLDRFDHHSLNEVLPFDLVNPSAENIARDVYTRLAAALPCTHIAEVQVYESPDAWATFIPD